MPSASPKYQSKTSALDAECFGGKKSLSSELYPGKDVSEGQRNQPCTSQKKPSSADGNAGEEWGGGGGGEMGNTRRAFLGYEERQALYRTFL